MAITVKCAACGNSAQVPDRAAGLKVRCKPCGAVVAVPKSAVEALVPAGQLAGAAAGSPLPSASPVALPPAPTQPAKVCTACGIEVAGRKRTKDPAGHYFCQPCWDAKLAAAAKGQPGAGVATGDAAEPTDFPCASCGTLGGPDDVYDDNGRYVCKSCWETQAATPAPGPSNSTVAANPLDGPVAANTDRLPPVPNTGGGPPPPPEMLFCEGCGGSFPMTALQTAADGAVLCQLCTAHRINPLARPAYAAPAVPAMAAASFAPAVPRQTAAPRADYSMYKPKRGGASGGAAVAGGGGLLFVVVLILRIGLRGCAAYERSHRHDRDDDDQGSVPVQVDAPAQAGVSPVDSLGR